MGSLSSHEDDVARLYFGQGKSYQEIASQYGVSREAVRQFLNRHFPDRVEGRTFRRDFQIGVREYKEQILIENAPPCVVCWKPVLRKTGGKGPNRTCSKKCQGLWTQARFLLDPQQRSRQRLSNANSIIRYPESHSQSALSWARKIVNGEPIKAKTRVRKDSQARRAYEEALRMRAEHSKGTE